MIELNNKGAKPIPTKNPGGREPIYPFADMEVDDSFTLPKDHDGCLKLTPKANPRVALAAHKYGKRHGKKFTYRTEEDGSVTVWRKE